MFSILLLERWERVVCSEGKLLLCLDLFANLMWFNEPPCYKLVPEITRCVKVSSLYLLFSKKKKKACDLILCLHL